MAPSRGCVDHSTVLSFHVSDSEFFPSLDRDRHLFVMSVVACVSDEGGTEAGSGKADGARTRTGAGRGGGTGAP